MSFAELMAVFESFNLNKDTIHRFTEEIFLIKSSNVSEEILLKIFNRLGGFVRFGYIIDDLDTFFSQSNFQGKITFGISIIGEEKKEDGLYIKKLSSQMKSGLKEFGNPSRYIKPLRGSNNLNAAQINKNEIITKGFELCIMRNDQEEIYGSTLGVQDIDSFAIRDFDKPFTDTKMGTLPPKLARIMVNLTGKREGIIWDPFCGSGTILMESATLGFDVLASDIDEYAVNNTDENIKWLASIGQIGSLEYEVFSMDVLNPKGRTMSKLRKTGISAVVCEPFMGPPQRNVLYPNKADMILDKVKELYEGLFNVLDRVARRGFIIVLIIPSYKTFAGWKTFSIRDIVGKSWEILNSKYSPGRDLKWSRKNSIITRNIFVLCKK